MEVAASSPHRARGWGGVRAGKARGPGDQSEKVHETNLPFAQVWTSGVSELPAVPGQSRPGVLGPQCPQVTLDSAMALALCVKTCTHPGDSSVAF